MTSFRVVPVLSVKLNVSSCSGIIIYLLKIIIISKVDQDEQTTFLTKVVMFPLMMTHYEWNMKPCDKSLCYSILAMFYSREVQIK